MAEAVFSQSADALIDALLAAPHPWRAGLDLERLAEGRAVELDPGPEAHLRFRTPSGKIEIRHPRDPEPLPRYLPPHSDGDPHPLQLVTAPAVQGLNSTFHEREDLRRRMGPMSLLMNPSEAAARGLADGDPVTAFNDLGEVAFTLKVTANVPPGLAVAEGVWWRRHAPGDRTVNALTSQRLTDRGGGSTYYDNRVDVRHGWPS